MSHWQESYLTKKVDARTALAAIKSGDNLIIGSCCSEPQTLIETLVEMSDRWEGLTLFTMVLGSPCLYARPELAPHMRVNTILPYPPMRESLASGQVIYHPYYLSQVPTFINSGVIPADVTLLQISPPDSRGNCSMGISVDFLPAAIGRSRLVIAEVNDQVPFTLGQGIIHVSKIDYIVETSRPLLQVIDEMCADQDILEAVAANVSQLVDDGATIQIGIGSLPNAIIRALKLKKNLGIHSGMISDGITDLVEMGVVNNSCKTINRGKIITTVILGTEKIYNWAKWNPILEMHPVEYTHNFSVITKISQFTAINSAFQVDLTGQVNAETINGRQVSAVGGQVDFMSAATCSPAGKAIIALRSATGDAVTSRIVARLGQGEAVSTPRSYVDYVVTEYGIAVLKGKSINSRAKELIKVAHPKFRAELEEFRQQYYPG
ncbi:MAG: acetyl-CoA hydrolase/transferase C-terminal domain-containing protein [Carboxydocellales bacterium]|jgi:4-hydroxybutyrate CoA-transferase